MAQRDAVAAHGGVNLRELSGPDLMKRADYLAATYSQMRQLVAKHTANSGLGFEEDFESLAQVGVSQVSHCGQWLGP